MTNLINIITMKNIIIYFISINLISFLAMFIDKRRAEKNEWRIQESTLLLLAIIGGSIGSILGMYVFHHKTKKLKFSVGFPVILLVQIAIIVYFMYSK